MAFNFDIYMYNWTNSEEFTTQQAASKPVLVQLGPYRFKESHEKVNITWNSHNSTVTYRKRSKFIFDERGSNGSLDDLIININPIAVVSVDLQVLSHYGQKIVVRPFQIFKTNLVLCSPNKFEGGRSKKSF